MVRSKRRDLPASSKKSNRSRTAPNDPLPSCALCTSGWLNDCIGAETVNWTSTVDRPQPLRRGPWLGDCFRLAADAQSGPPHGCRFQYLTFTNVRGERSKLAEAV